MQLSVPIHSYQHRSRPASTARLVNCYPELLPQDAKTPVLLTRSPGIASWTTVGTGSIAGMLPALNKLYTVSGSSLYETDSNKVSTLLGSVGSPGNIDMAANGSAVVVVNEPNAFYWDGSTFGQITDADFTSRGAGDVEFLDNFMLFREPDSDRFFGADLGTVTDFDALQFANSDANPDILNGMKVDHRQVVLASANSMEIFQNTGASGFPIERAINGYVEQGCLNGRTLQKQDQTVFWLADDYTVRKLSGLTPVRVSTHAIEQAIGQRTIATASAFTYSQYGHLFYVLNFSDGTFVYDATADTWHERLTYGDDSWKIKHHAQAFGLELVGDSQSNKIGYLDADTYSEFGDLQRMEWTYQPVYAEGRRAFHSRLEVVLETGVGLVTGQGSDPQLMMDYSDDGGLTWNSLPNRSIGGIGERYVRCIWNALGSSTQRVYRGAISDPVKVTITDTPNVQYMTLRAPSRSERWPP